MLVKFNHCFCLIPPSKSEQLASLANILASARLLPSASRQQRLGDVANVPQLSMQTATASNSILRSAPPHLPLPPHPALRGTCLQCWRQPHPSLRLAHGAAASRHLHGTCRDDPLRETPRDALREALREARPHKAACEAPNQCGAPTHGPPITIRVSTGARQSQVAVGGGGRCRGGRGRGARAVLLRVPPAAMCKLRPMAAANGGSRGPADEAVTRPADRRHA